MAKFFTRNFTGFFIHILKKLLTALSTANHPHSYIRIGDYPLRINRLAGGAGELSTPVRVGELGKI
jgi:hypothetical protein